MNEEWIWIEYPMPLIGTRLMTQEQAIHRYHTNAEFHAGVHLVGLLLAGHALPGRLLPYVRSVTV